VNTSVAISSNREALSKRRFCGDAKLETFLVRALPPISHLWFVDYYIISGRSLNKHILSNYRPRYNHGFITLWIHWVSLHAYQFESFWKNAAGKKSHKINGIMFRRLYSLYLDYIGKFGLSPWKINRIFYVWGTYFILDTYLATLIYAFLQHLLNWTL
jgi:hypothetical protein